MRPPAVDKFIDENSEWPQVGGEVVTSVEYDFRRHVLRRAAERPRLVTVLADVLRETEIDLPQPTRITDSVLRSNVFFSFKYHNNNFYSAVRS